MIKQRITHPDNSCLIFIGETHESLPFGVGVLLNTSEGTSLLGTFSSDFSLISNLPAMLRRSNGDVLVFGNGVAACFDAKSGNRYEGEAEGGPHDADGLRLDGLGMRSCTDGSTYTGSFLDGVAVGLGVWQLAKLGSTYLGYFAGDRPNGPGCHFLGGGLYQGELMDGKRDGFGSFTDGKLEDRGQWINDRFMKKGEFDGQVTVAVEAGYLAMQDASALVTGSVRNVLLRAEAVRSMVTKICTKVRSIQISVHQELGIAEDVIPPMPNSFFFIVAETQGPKSHSLAQRKQDLMVTTPPRNAHVALANKTMLGSDGKRRDEDDYVPINTLALSVEARKRTSSWGSGRKRTSSLSSDIGSSPGFKRKGEFVDAVSTPFGKSTETFDTPGSGSVYRTAARPPNTIMPTRTREDDVLETGIAIDLARGGAICAEHAEMFSTGGGEQLSFTEGGDAASISGLSRAERPMQRFEKESAFGSGQAERSIQEFAEESLANDEQSTFRTEKGGPYLGHDAPRLGNQFEPPRELHTGGFDSPEIHHSHSYVDHRKAGAITTASRLDFESAGTNDDILREYHAHVASRAEPYYPSNGTQPVHDQTNDEDEDDQVSPIRNQRVFIPLPGSGGGNDASFMVLSPTRFRTPFVGKTIPSRGPMSFTEFERDEDQDSFEYSRFLKKNDSLSFADLQAEDDVVREGGSKFSRNSASSGVVDGRQQGSFDVLHAPEQMLNRASRGAGPYYASVESKNAMPSQTLSFESDSMSIAYARGESRFPPTKAVADNELHRRTKNGEGGESYAGRMVRNELYRSANDGEGVDFSVARAAKNQLYRGANDGEGFDFSLARAAKSELYRDVNDGEGLDFSVSRVNKKQLYRDANDDRAGDFNAARAIKSGLFQNANDDGAGGLNAARSANNTSHRDGNDDGAGEFNAARTTESELYRNANDDGASGLDLYKQANDDGSGKFNAARVAKNGPYYDIRHNISNRAEDSVKYSKSHGVFPSDDPRGEFGDLQLAERDLGLARGKRVNNNVSSYESMDRGTSPTGGRDTSNLAPEKVAFNSLSRDPRQGIDEKFALRRNQTPFKRGSWEGDIGEQHESDQQTSDFAGLHRGRNDVGIANQNDPSFGTLNMAQLNHPGQFFTHRAAVVVGRDAGETADQQLCAQKGLYSNESDFMGMSGRGLVGNTYELKKAEVISTPNEETILFRKVRREAGQNDQKEHPFALLNMNGGGGGGGRVLRPEFNQAGESTFSDTDSGFEELQGVQRGVGKPRSSNDEQQRYHGHDQSQRLNLSKQSGGNVLDSSVEWDSLPSRGGNDDGAKFGNVASSRLNSFKGQQEVDDRGVRQQARKFDESGSYSSSNMDRAAVQPSVRLKLAKAKHRDPLSGEFVSSIDDVVDSAAYTNLSLGGASRSANNGKPHFNESTPEQPGSFTSLNMDRAAAQPGERLTMAKAKLRDPVTGDDDADSAGFTNLGFAGATGLANNRKRDPASGEFVSGHSHDADSLSFTNLGFAGASRAANNGKRYLYDPMTEESGSFTSLNTDRAAMQPGGRLKIAKAKLRDPVMGEFVSSRDDDDVDSASFGNVDFAGTSRLVGSSRLANTRRQYVSEAFAEEPGSFTSLNMDRAAVQPGDRLKMAKSKLRDPRTGKFVSDHDDDVDPSSLANNGKQYPDERMAEEAGSFASFNMDCAASRPGDRLKMAKVKLRDPATGEFITGFDKDADLSSFPILGFAGVSRSANKGNQNSDGSTPEQSGSFTSLSMDRAAMQPGDRMKMAESKLRDPVTGDFVSDPGDTNNGDSFLFVNLGRAGTSNSSYNKKPYSDRSMPEQPGAFISLNMEHSDTQPGDRLKVAKSKLHDPRLEEFESGLRDDVDFPSFLGAPRFTNNGKQYSDGSALDQPGSFVSLNMDRASLQSGDRLKVAKSQIRDPRTGEVIFGVDDDVDSSSFTTVGFVGPSRLSNKGKQYSDEPMADEPGSLTSLNMDRAAMQPGDRLNMVAKPKFRDPLKVEFEFGLGGEDEDSSSFTNLGFEGTSRLAASSRSGDLSRSANNGKQYSDKSAPVQPGFFVSLNMDRAALQPGDRLKMAKSKLRDPHPGEFASIDEPDSASFGDLGFTGSSRLANKGKQHSNGATTEQPGSFVSLQFDDRAVAIDDGLFARKKQEASSRGGRAGENLDGEAGDFESLINSDKGRRAQSDVFQNMASGTDDAEQKGRVSTGDASFISLKKARLGKSGLTSGERGDLFGDEEFVSLHRNLPNRDNDDNGFAADDGRSTLFVSLHGIDDRQQVTRGNEGELFSRTAGRGREGIDRGLVSRDDDGRHEVLNVQGADGAPGSFVNLQINGRERVDGDDQVFVTKNIGAFGAKAHDPSVTQRGGRSGFENETNTGAPNEFMSLQMDNRKRVDGYSRNGGDRRNGGDLHVNAYLDKEFKSEGGNDQGPGAFVSLQMRQSIDGNDGVFVSKPGTGAAPLEGEHYLNARMLAGAIDCTNEELQFRGDENQAFKEGFMDENGNRRAKRSGLPRDDDNPSSSFVSLRGDDGNGINGRKNQHSAHRVAGDLDEFDERSRDFVSLKKQRDLINPIDEGSSSENVPMHNMHMDESGLQKVRRDRLDKAYAAKDLEFESDVEYEDENDLADKEPGRVGRLKYERKFVVGQDGIHRTIPEFTELRMRDRDVEPNNGKGFSVRGIDARPVVQKTATPIFPSAPSSPSSDEASSQASLSTIQSPEDVSHELDVSVGVMSGNEYANWAPEGDVFKKEAQIVQPARRLAYDRDGGLFGNLVDGGKLAARAPLVAIVAEKPSVVAAATEVDKRPAVMKTPQHEKPRKVFSSSRYKPGLEFQSPPPPPPPTRWNGNNAMDQPTPPPPPAMPFDDEPGAPLEPPYAPYGTPRAPLRPPYPPPMDNDDGFFSPPPPPPPEGFFGNSY